MNIAPCLTSKNEHYCTPNEILDPVHRLLVPRGSNRKLIDPATNDASQVLANYLCTGGELDGLTCDWSIADTWYCNPPYGSKIKAFAERMAYWGRTRGLPGIALLPARDDTGWCQEHIFRTADAWVHVRGRLTFWLPIPLARDDAPPQFDANGKEIERYYLRRWFPAATDDNLPAPFRSIAPGYAIGPELGANGKPQSAPFPSLIAFWADPHAAEFDPKLERDVLRELVRAARTPVASTRTASAGMGRDVERFDTWLAESEAVLGSKRFADDRQLDPEIFDRYAEATRIDSANPHPINVVEFAKRFLPLGMLTIARGPRRGVWFR